MTLLLQMSTSDLENVDWLRFNSYTTRVRSVSYKDRDVFRGCQARLSSQLFAAILLHRPADHGALLPKVGSIHWICLHGSPLETLPPFVTSNTKTLSIVGGPDTKRSCTKVLKTLSSRPLSLTRFSLAMDEPDEELFAGLVTFFTPQVNLVVVEIPPFSATQDIVRVLGRLGQLKQWKGFSLVGKHQVPTPGGMLFDWESDMFCALEELHLCASLPDASEIFKKTGGRPITALAITSRTPSSQAELRHFATTIATALTEHRKPATRVIR